MKRLYPNRLHMLTAMMAVGIAGMSTTETMAERVSPQQALARAKQSEILRGHFINFEGHWGRSFDASLAVTLLRWHGFCIFLN